MSTAPQSFLEQSAYLVARLPVVLIRITRLPRGAVERRALPLITGSAQVVEVHASRGLVGTLARLFLDQGAIEATAEEVAPEPAPAPARPSGYGRNTPPRRARTRSLSLRDPSLDHRVDILESEHPRRVDVVGESVRVIDLDPEACRLEHPDHTERNRFAATLLGVHGEIGL